MWWLAVVGCDPLVLDPPPATAWVVYDPGTGEIPVPNDLARDAAAEHLALFVVEKGCERLFVLNHQDPGQRHRALLSPLSPATPCWEI